MLQELIGYLQRRKIVPINLNVGLGRYESESHTKAYLPSVLIPTRGP